MIVWEKLHALAIVEDHLGMLAYYLNDADPRPAKEQFEFHYAHGGGWQPLIGFVFTGRNMYYPGDPALLPLFRTKLREETITVYENAWVCIMQANGDFETARMD